MDINKEKALSTKIEEINIDQIDTKFLKEYMRIDFDDEDNDKMITMLLSAAKSFAQTYLRWNDEEFKNSPTEINIAILAISEHWYKNRGVLNEDATRKELPFVFSGILDIHRNWEVRSGDMDEYTTIG